MGINHIIKWENSLTFLNYSNLINKDINTLPKIMQAIHPKSKVET